MYFWIMMIIFLTLLEVFTVDLVSIWFIASAIVSLIFSIFIDNFLLEFAIFVILGVILLLSTRKYLVKKLMPKKIHTNSDRVIGMEGIVTKKTSKMDVGEVKVDGKYWSAYSSELIESGSIVTILEINGVKLKVKRSEK